MNVRVALAKFLHQVDFWSVRSPLADRPSFRAPDYILRAMPRQETRQEISLVVPTWSGISTFKNMLMSWRSRGDEQFSVIGDDKQLRELVTTAFLRRPYNAPSLLAWAGNLDDLDDLFRSLAEQLLIEGRVWVAATWRTHREGRRNLTLPQFHIQRRADIKWTRGAAILRLRRSWPGEDFEEVQVDVSDVVEFSWPLPGIKYPGCSPVDRVVPLHLRQNELIDMSVEILRVQTQQDDHRLRAERARWMDAPRNNAKLADIHLAISAELYEVVPNKPMTKYFDGYQVLQMYHRHAIVREALLSGFNHFLARYSALVRPRAASASLELLQYPSARFIQDVIDKYTRKEVDIEAAADMVRPKDRRDS